MLSTHFLLDSCQLVHKPTREVGVQDRSRDRLEPKNCKPHPLVTTWAKTQVSRTFPFPYINRPFLSPFINLDLYLLCNFSVHIKHFGSKKSAKYKVITNGLHQSARKSMHIHVKQIKTSFSKSDEHFSKNLKKSKLCRKSCCFCLKGLNFSLKFWYVASFPLFWASSRLSICQNPVSNMLLICKLNRKLK